MNLYIESKPSTRPLPIFHYVRYKGKLFKISTTHQIESKHWDTENQCVRRTRTNYNEFNGIFKSQQNKIEAIILKLERTERPVTKDNIVAQLSFVTKTIEAKENTPLTIFQIFIDQYGSDKAKRTTDGYSTTLTHLTKYSNDLETTPIRFENFGVDFYKFFRVATDLHDNAFGFHIKNMKTFLKWAAEKGYHDTAHFKKWKVTTEEKDEFFLKWEEILLMTNTILEKRLENVKDLFLIGCFTGFAFSDIQQLKPVHLQNGVISKTRMKTKAALTVPVTPELQKIFNKYWGNNQPLPSISNQKGNEYLKEIGKELGFTRQFNYVQQKGRKTDETTKEAWQCMKWHTARHSFITNCIQLGIKPDAVRQMVGHKSFKMLSKYIQNDPEFLKKEMTKMNKK